MATFGLGIIGTWQIPDNTITTAKILDGTILDADMSFRTLKKVAETTLVAQATTITFTGLDINTDQEYFIVVNWLNSAAGNTTLSMYVNNDTTATNYYCEEGFDSGAGRTVANINDARVAGITNAGAVSGIGVLFRDVTGNPRASFNTTELATTLVRNYSYAMVKTATVANITQLDFTASAANGLDVGTRITIYGSTASGV
mgnify:CR=1 FL=1